MIKLGAFSVSLAVKDTKVSQAFYEKLGFETTGGNIEQKWLIPKNGDAVIGLFQSMFDKNILTFNPGWNQNAEDIEVFDDIRQIENHLISQDLTPANKIESESGPAYLTLTDPDGNVILIDQHR